MSNEVEFNSLTANDEAKVKLEQPASRVPQKPTDEEVAKYSKTRIVLVVIFALIIIAMVVAAVIIIIVSPKCSKTKDDSWYKNKIVYQIYTRSFKDSDGDGNGDLKGITEKMDYLKDLGVEILCLTPIYKSPMKNGGYDIEDFRDVDKIFGEMSDFEALVKKAKENGIQIVLDFVPNHTSDQHKWFNESRSKVDSEKRDWYVWANKSNNWPSVFGGRAWEKDSSTNQLYLHQFSVNEPDLNLRNDDVISELNSVLKFWMNKGVEGFRANAIQYLLEDKNLKDDTAKANYFTNATVPLTYDMTDHKSTYDLPGNLDVVKKFRAALDGADTYKLLILAVEGSPKTTSSFFKVGGDIPTFAGLIKDVKKGADVSVAINKTVSEYLAAIPEGKLPNFVIGNQDNERVSDRVGSHLVDAMNVLLLTLPGTPTTYYGEEIGMANTQVITPVDKQGHDDMRTPMQWTNGIYAGFTSNTSKPWLDVNSNRDKVNVESEKNDQKSHFNVYKAVAKLRSENAFKSAEFKVVHVDSQVFAYTRGDEYLVVINFSNVKWDKDLNEISGRGEIKMDSKFGLEGTVDVNKLALEGGQAVVLALNYHKYL